MKAKLIFGAILVAFIMLSGNDDPAVKKGKYSEWIKGNGIYANVEFLSNAGLSIKIRNSSKVNVPVIPIRAVGWFNKKAGSQPCDFIYGDFSGGDLAEIRLKVKMSDGQEYEIMANPNKPVLMIRPGEEVAIVFNFWKNNRISSDNIPAKKLLLYIGPNHTQYYESFQIEMENQK